MFISRKFTLNMNHLKINQFSNFKILIDWLIYLSFKIFSLLSNLMLFCDCKNRLQERLVLRMLNGDTVFLLLEDNWLQEDLLKTFKWWHSLNLLFQPLRYTFYPRTKTNTLRSPFRISYHFVAAGKTGWSDISLLNPLNQVIIPAGRMPWSYAKL